MKRVTVIALCLALAACGSSSNSSKQEPRSQSDLILTIDQVPQKLRFEPRGRPLSIADKDFANSVPKEVWEIVPTVERWQRFMVSPIQFAAEKKTPQEAAADAKFTKSCKNTYTPSGSDQIWQAKLEFGGAECPTEGQLSIEVKGQISDADGRMQSLEIHAGEINAGSSVKTSKGLSKKMTYQSKMFHQVFYKAPLKPESTTHWVSKEEGKIQLLLESGDSITVNTERMTLVRPGRAEAIAHYAYRLKLRELIDSIHTVNQDSKKVVETYLNGERIDGSKKDRRIDALIRAIESARIQERK